MIGAGANGLRQSAPLACRSKALEITGKSPVRRITQRNYQLDLGNEALDQARGRLAVEVPRGCLAYHSLGCSARKQGFVLFQRSRHPEWICVVDAEVIRLLDRAHVNIR